MKKWIALAGGLPLVISLIWLQYLPDRVGVHYDISGEPDRWGSKWELLILPGIALVLAAGFLIAIRVLERKAAGAEQDRAQAYAGTNARTAAWVALAMGLFFTGLQIYFLLAAGRSAGSEAAPAANAAKVTGAGMGLLLIVLGNLMPKSRKNSAMGMRCKWSMYNDETWRRSNRAAGIVSIAAGAAIFVAVLLAPSSWAIPILLAGLAGMLAASMLCARKIYKEETAKTEG